MFDVTISVCLSLKFNASKRGRENKYNELIIIIDHIGTDETHTHKKKILVVYIYSDTYLSYSLITQSYFETGYQSKKIQQRTFAAHKLISILFPFKNSLTPIQKYF